MKFVIVNGNKTLAYQGKNDGLFIVLAGDPEFLNDVQNPVITDRETAKLFAKKYGGMIKEF